MKVNGFAKNLKYFRKLAGLTQEQVAEQADISYSFYTKLENSNSLPSLDTLIKICGVLKIPMDLLLKDGGWRFFSAYADLQFYNDLMNMPDDQFALYSAVLEKLHCHMKTKELENKPELPENSRTENKDQTE
jgi:transcriptional regulator with XRE-family HTH domain